MTSSSAIYPIPALTVPLSRWRHLPGGGRAGPGSGAGAAALAVDKGSTKSPCCGLSLAECQTDFMSYRENFWVTVGTAAPVIALAAIVSLPDVFQAGQQRVNALVPTSSD